MKFIIAFMLLLAGTTVANAYCVSLPDNQQSAYVKNSLNKTICLNADIAQDTATRNWQVEVDAANRQLDRDFVGQKLNSIKPVEIPPYVGPRPAWP